MTPLPKTNLAEQEAAIREFIKNGGRVQKLESGYQSKPHRTHTSKYFIHQGKEVAIGKKSKAEAEKLKQKELEKNLKAFFEKHPNVQLRQHEIAAAMNIKVTLEFKKALMALAEIRCLSV